VICARFESRCACCGDDIAEGDRIGEVDGEWCCAKCVEDEGGEDDE
jgi:hypothetical protein